MQDQSTDRLFATLEGAAKHADEAALTASLVRNAGLSDQARAMISHRAAELVREIRSSQRPTLMEHFLAEYGLSTREGVALMCLAEAMLRVPDKLTIDALIEDKIAPSDWSSHVGRASSPLVNASTWALMLTGKVLDDEGPRMAATLRGAVKRLGEPVIRTAVGRAMKEMGRQFVLGETIQKAMERAKARESQGYTYSYDMLGEAAMTAGDAARYARDYADAIAAIAHGCTHAAVKDNPGISIKLSALHPRYEVAQEDRVMEELVPVVSGLARKARAAGMGLNIDAEEQDRLVLSLKVIEAVLKDPELAGWEGFGVVVQAYGKRAGAVIDWLYRTARKYDRRLMVRLVKGAYWDTEMKLAQVEGLEDFPLFTSKVATDVSYIANARKLIGYADRIYPQFATHNAHTVAAVLEMAEGIEYEFQRLHGMGERLHDIVIRQGNGRCRIYAPVGAHKDLLAYLVRRLLENGANSSFVNQIVDEDVTPEEIALDPFDALAGAKAPQGLEHPRALFGEGRRNSRGFDLTDEEVLAGIYAVRDVQIPDAGPLVAGVVSGTARDVVNPADGSVVAQVREADEACVAGAIAAAAPWDASPDQRAVVLKRAADLYEANFGLFFAALAREAGKTLNDCVGELREAVDFLRYYANEGARREDAPRGIFTAISPWNFPLAIFTGQVSAALAAGNGVLAKPAEQTCLTAAIAVRLLHEAGVPAPALQLPARRWPGRCAADRLGPGAGRRLHRLDRDGEDHPPGHGRGDDPRRPAGGRDRRAERDDRRQHRPARAGGTRYHRLVLPVGGAAVLGPALPLLARGYRAADDRDDQGRHGRAARGRSLAAVDRRRPGDRRRGAQRHCRLCRRGARRRAPAARAAGARGRHLRRPHPAAGRRHRGNGARDLRPGAACRHLQGA